MEMIVRKLIIKNKLGLHARPAKLFVETASQYDSDVMVSQNGLEVNGKSIMGIMMLAAEGGSEIVLKVDGDDEEELLQAISKLIDDKFYEK
jgi:phosphocarrier protein HPr